MRYPELEEQTMNDRPCDFPADPNKDPDGTSRLVQICHTVHLESMLGILKSGKIKANPSRHNEVTRAGVSAIFLATNAGSPNRYGSYQMRFTFEDLARGRQAWWVGVDHYQETSEPCIWLASQRPPDTVCLKHYDPHRAGPWQVISGVNFFNSRPSVYLDFMINDNLGLELVEELSTVYHDKLKCSVLSGGKCPEAGKTAGQSASRLLACVTTQSIPHHEAFGKHGTPSDLTKNGAEYLVSFRAKRMGPLQGNVSSSSHQSDRLAHKAITAYSEDNCDSLENIIRQFTSHEDWGKVVRRTIAEYFQVSPESLIPQTEAY